jgi:hypothetical protein
LGFAFLAPHSQIAQSPDNRAAFQPSFPINSAPPPKQLRVFSNKNFVAEILSSKRKETHALSRDGV